MPVSFKITTTHLCVLGAFALVLTVPSSAFASGEAINAAKTELSSNLEAVVSIAKVFIALGAIIAVGGAIYNFLVEKNQAVLIGAGIGLAVAGVGGAVLGLAKGFAS